MDSNQDRKTYTRRDLLKLAGAGGVGLLLGAGGVGSLMMNSKTTASGSPALLHLLPKTSFRFTGSISLAL